MTVAARDGFERSAQVSEHRDSPVSFAFDEQPVRELGAEARASRATEEVVDGDGHDATATKARCSRNVSSFQSGFSCARESGPDSALPLVPAVAGTAARVPAAQLAEQLVRNCCYTVGVREWSSVVSERDYPVRQARGPLLATCMKPSTTPRSPRLRAAQVLALGPAVAAIALSGCGMSTASSTGQGSASAPTPALTSPTIGSPSAHSSSAPTPASAERPQRAGQSHGGLAYSTASSQTAQSQPAPGSCHAIGSGPYSRPDPRCTPGALNPAVAQATIGQTICQAGWTDTVRPPESVTEPEKDASMAAYGDSGPMSDYEYDHFVPLELGGAVNDSRNLWPEPGASPNPKDRVEDELNQKVCDRQMTLAQAQRAITSNWVALAARASAPAASGSTSTLSTTSSGPSAGAQCTVTASYSDRYHDYDVYVHSNQPDETVTVIDAAARTATWHTNSGGYADVYFHARPRPPRARRSQRMSGGTSATRRSNQRLYRCVLARNRRCDPAPGDLKPDRLGDQSRYRRRRRSVR